MVNVNDIIKWESGEMTQEQERRFFQRMVNSGEVWHLQGMYGRRAQDLLDAGEIEYPKKRTRDFYGNPIPTKQEISNKRKRKQLRDMT